MKKIKLKKPVLYGMYTGLFALLLGALYYVDFSNKNLAPSDKATDDDMQYVSRLFGSDDIPVVNTESVIMRPYIDDSIKIVQNFYNYKGSEKEQENSIINYEQTYIQNSGVAYGGPKGAFDVASSLDGTVTSVKEDKLLGTIVEIQSSDKVITIYQTLTDVKVKKDDKVKQGDIIGKSGVSNMNKDLGNHFVFEIKVNGTYVNPEEYYDKNINEL
ncbi:MAG: M23 family metallopeptidase [Bacilli bacterium]|nr:M23 family metallopeptidase [Bacilli bacterium]